MTKYESRLRLEKKQVQRGRLRHDILSPQPYSYAKHEPVAASGTPVDPGPRDDL